MENIQYLIILILSGILLAFLTAILASKGKKKKDDQLNSMFTICITCMLIWTISLILQILCQNTSINPVFFEGLASFGACFVPVFFMLCGIVFFHTRINLNWKHILLFVVPVLSTILMFTNEYHHLFYKVYSTSLSDTVYGPYMTIHSLYSYISFIIGLGYFLAYSIKNSGFFSKQSILIFLGVCCPLIINILSTFGIVSLTVYATPVAFAISIIFFSIAIFKFGFLNITPIALKKVVNRISDSYIVLNNDLVIVDFNETLLKTFKAHSESIINKNLFEIKKAFKDFNSISKKIENAIKKTRTSDATVVLDEYFESVNKYFHIEINRLTDGNNLLGTLLLIKDVTQHKLDLDTIKTNQDILIERERLASLGQMIGGIAHNLKTPIMSISGASEGVLDLVKEYKTSIGDSDVTTEDHLEIAREMEEWIRKIQSHLSYMSDVITTVKGQAVAFSDNTTFTSFTLDDFIRQVNILMKHELSHSLVELEESSTLPEDTVVKGNINSLVQVVNNIISNAIQAYDGKSGQKIVLNIYKEKNMLVIKIQDFAGGIPDSVKSKLFKEMTTTKGKNGTGLGLFMSYSNIKAHFNGNIRFETRKGKGTSFYIEIPV